MNILLIFPSFIIAFIIVFYYERKIRRTEPRNKVHFYVARDKNGLIYLYLGKPIRCGSCFCTDNNVQLIASETNFEAFNLRVDDFKDLKWEDEPVEVFINLEDLLWKNKKV